MSSPNMPFGDKDYFELNVLRNSRYWSSFGKRVEVTFYKENLHL